MEEHRLIELVASEVSGSLTQEERTELDSLLNDPYHKKAYDEMQAQWAHAGRLKANVTINTEASWYKFHQRVNVRKRQFAPMLARIAAILVIGMGIAFYLLNNSFSPSTIVTTKEGEVIEFKLPDGSRVWLNENSSLAYDESFNNQNRSLSFQGEGFFEVAHDPNKPFVIDSRDTQVEVIGTSFNVAAGSDARSVEVNVSTGRVAFRSKKSRQELILNAGMAGVFDLETRLLSVTDSHVGNFNFWRTKVLQFDDTPLSDVVEDLEKNFGVNITIDKRKVGACKFTGTFEKPSLEELLEIISITMDVTVQKVGGGYQLLGSGCNN